MKEIRYPSDKWIADYMTARKCDKETADMAWWDLEIEKGNPTPFDLTEDQVKVAKTMTKGARAVNAYGKEVKRERKPNEDKREIIQTIADNLSRVFGPDGEKPEGITIANVERQIDFLYRGVNYSVTLTAHRQPKG